MKVFITVLIAETAVLYQGASGRVGKLPRGCRLPPSCKTWGQKLSPQGQGGGKRLLADDLLGGYRLALTYDLGIRLAVDRQEVPQGYCVVLRAENLPEGTETVTAVTDMGFTPTFYPYEGAHTYCRSIGSWKGPSQYFSESPRFFRGRVTWQGRWLCRSDRVPPCPHL